MMKTLWQFLLSWRNTFRVAHWALWIVALAVMALFPAQSWAQDGRYQTRRSDCRQEPPPGKPLAVRKSDTGVKVQGYVASRVVTQTASAAGLEGGELVVCSEYGRVEIIDSDDDQVRLQIRWDAFGEGSAQPGEAAKRVIEETEVQAHLTGRQGRLMVRVWHPRLGFTAPGGQPPWVSVRLQVPSRGAYSVRTEAFHGLVSVRRLTLASAILRGAVGEKFKGIPGFIGATELDNVELAGDVEIDNLAGLPGIRPSVAPEQAAPTAPILVKARIASSCQLKAVTGGDINIAIQPDPSLGVRAWGGANNGAVDRKSTRLNSSHQLISYAVFCLKNKKQKGATGSLSRFARYHGYVEQSLGLK